MRRTVLSALALACTAVLASTVPAFADGSTPTPTPATSRPAAKDEPPTAAAVPPSKAKSTEPSTAKPGQVGAVPKGAPNTGVAPVASHSGTNGGLIGGGAAAALALGGGAVLLVRRRRATGA